MSSLKIYITSMLMFFLCGCSLFKPYIDRRRNPGVSDVTRLYTGPSKPQMPVICYNPLLTDEAELQKMADEECIKNETGDHAVFSQTTYLTGKLLLPNHAYYFCVRGNEQIPTDVQEQAIRNTENEMNNRAKEEEEKLEEEDDEFTIRE